jgi:hypothetical protein
MYKTILWTSVCGISGGLLWSTIGKLRNNYFNEYNYRNTILNWGGFFGVLIGLSRAYKGTYLLNFNQKN